MIRVDNLIRNYGDLTAVDKVSFEIVVTLDEGKRLNYKFYKDETESHYILKRSDMDRYFQIASYQVNPLKEASREKLVIAKEPQPEQTPEIKTSQNDVE